MASRINHLQTAVHIICLLGAGGSGKEKKGSILCQLFNCGRLVMSKLIDRAKKNKKVELANYNEIIRGGGLINDELVIEEFENAVMECHANGHNIIIADGFPRSPGQAKWLIKSRINYSIILLNIDKETSLERIAIRANEEGGRVDDDDDDDASDRYETYMDKTIRGFRKLARDNPKSVVKIDAKQLVLIQICQIINHVKRRINGLDIKNIQAQLDDTQNPIHQSIQAIDAASPVLVQQNQTSRFNKMAQLYIPNFAVTVPAGARFSAR